MRKINLLFFLILGVFLISLVSASGFGYDTEEDVSSTVTVYSGINITNLSQLVDVNVPTPGDDEVLTWDDATDLWIAQAVGAITKWIVSTANGYLYNNSNTVYFNDSQLNLTIDARATGLGDNASWNESYADTLYAGISVVSNPFDQVLNTTSNVMFNSINATDWSNVTLTESDPIWTANYSIFAGLINNQSYLATCSDSSCNTIFYWANQSYLNETDLILLVNTTSNLQELLNNTGIYGTYNATYDANIDTDCDGGSCVTVFYWANQSYLNETILALSINTTSNIQTLLNGTGIYGAYNITYAKWAYNQTTPAQTYADAQDTAYNTSMKNYCDATDLSYNTSMKNYVDVRDLFFNTSIKNHITVMDLFFNTSMKNYVDTEISGVSAIDTNVSTICGDNEVLLGQDAKVCVSLNDTIDAREIGNSSWNQSYADTLYADVNVVSNPFDQVLNKSSNVMFNSINATDWSNVSLTEADPIWTANYSIFAGLIDNASYLAICNDGSCNAVFYWANQSYLNETALALSINTTSNIQNLLNGTGIYGTYNATYAANLDTNCSGGSCVSVFYWANQSYLNETTLALSINTTSNLQELLNATGIYGTYNVTYAKWAYNQTAPAQAYADTQDVAYNTSIKNYADTQDVAYNTSIKNYADTQDVAYNTSMKNYVDTEVAGAGGGNASWNQSHANTLYIGNNSAGWYLNITKLWTTMFHTLTSDFEWTVTDDGSDMFVDFSEIGGQNSLFIETAGTFIEMIANPGPANDYEMIAFEETQGADTSINFYEGGTGHNRIWSSGSVRIGSDKSSLCSNITSDVDCDTSGTGADLVVQDDGWFGGKLFSFDWSNVSIEESQISDLSHTVDTNVSSICGDDEILLGQDAKLCVSLNDTIDARSGDFAPNTTSAIQDLLNHTGVYGTYNATYDAQIDTNCSGGSCVSVFYWANQSYLNETTLVLSINTTPNLQALLNHTGVYGTYNATYDANIDTNCSGGSCATVFYWANQSYLNETDLALSINASSNAMDIIYNTSIKNYVDTMDLLFNVSIKNHISVQDLLYNASIKNYIDAQNIVYNTSMKNYVDTEIAGVSANLSWNETKARELFALNVSALYTTYNATYDSFILNVSINYTLNTYTAYDSKWTATYNSTYDAKVTFPGWTNVAWINESNTFVPAQTFSNNITVEGIKLEQDAANHRIYDNASCMILEAGATKLIICE